MRPRSAIVLGLACMLGLAVLPAAANKHGQPSDGSSSKKLTLLGETDDDRSAATLDEAFFTDAAFQGGYAYQGTWNGGFRVMDISRPWRPKPVAEVDCGASEGDIGVYGDLVFRSVDVPVAAATVEETCDAPPAASGFEGIQIFEVRRPWRASARDLVAAVPTDCGSHTHTVVPDPRHGRVLLYVSNATTAPVYDNDPVWRQECSVEHEKFQIVSVPLHHPEDAEVITDVPLGRGESCHDIGVLLTRRTKLAACAGREVIVFDIHRLDEPERVSSFTHANVPSWSSAMLSRDGRVTAVGWEPGGGFAADCEADDPARFRKIFFYDTRSGEQLGKWVLPRTQTAEENCAVHNFSVIPNATRNLLTVGAYQAGTYVVDFTDPAHPTTLAWYDPAPLDPDALTLGGAWGSYWYRGFVYESDITQGLNVYRLEDRSVKAKSEKVELLNPQTLIWYEGWRKRKHRHW